MIEPEPDCEITLLPPAATIVAAPVSTNNPPPVLDKIGVPDAAVIVDGEEVSFTTKLYPAGTVVVGFPVRSNSCVVPGVMVTPGITPLEDVTETVPAVAAAARAFEICWATEIPAPAPKVYVRVPVLPGTVTVGIKISVLMSRRVTRPGGWMPST
jgi:hypothetical protein